MLVLMAASWQPAADIGGAGGPEGDIIAAVRRVGLQARQRWLAYFFYVGFLFVVFTLSCYYCSTPGTMQQ